MNFRYIPEVGDYVLGTVWSDGDPNDPFVVGFIEGFMNDGGKIIVTGNDGKSRACRRVERLTEEEGRKLVQLIKEISDKRGPSLYWHLGVIRNKLEGFCPECGYETNACRCSVGKV